MMKAFQFTGRGSEYFGIWIVNILLTIVTFSLYHPWAKVRTSRYFLANTVLDDRNFEYHATGKQLFVGYIITLILVVLYVGLTTIFPLAGIVSIAVLFLAVPWIIWRSLGFSARMTSFSTVRFGFDGTGWGAYLNYMIMPLLFVGVLLIAPILSVAFPYLGLGSALENSFLILGLSLVGYVLAFFLYCKTKKMQTRYVINGYRYGQGHFTTAVRARGFAFIILKTIGLYLLMMVAVLVIVGLLAFATGVSSDLLSIAGQMDDPEALKAAASSAGVISLLVAVYAGLLLVGMLIFSYTYTRQRAYIYANSQLDNAVSFASTLGARRHAWVVISNFLLIIVTLGLGIPWAHTRAARMLAEHTEVDAGHGFDDYVTQQQAKQSSLGEQIGDAFDVDVGIGF